MLATCPQCDHEDKLDALRTELAATRIKLEEAETDRDNQLEHNQHMLKIAKANGFECLTDAIAAAMKAHAMLERIAYPRRGTKDESATLQQFADEIQAGWSLDILSNAEATESHAGGEHGRK